MRRFRPAGRQTDQRPAVDKLNSNQSSVGLLIIVLLARESQAFGGDRRDESLGACTAQSALQSGRVAVYNYSAHCPPLTVCSAYFIVRSVRWPVRTAHCSAQCACRLGLSVGREISASSCVCLPAKPNPNGQKWSSLSGGQTAVYTVQMCARLARRESAKGGRLHLSGPPPFGLARGLFRRTHGQPLGRNSPMQDR